MLGRKELVYILLIFESSIISLNHDFNDGKIIIHDSRDHEQAIPNKQGKDEVFSIMIDKIKDQNT